MSKFIPYFRGRVNGFLTKFSKIFKFYLTQLLNCGIKKGVKSYYSYYLTIKNKKRCRYRLSFLFVVF